MEEIKKIDLNSGNLNEVKNSPDKRKISLQIPKLAIISIIVLILLGIGSFFAIFLPAKEVYASATKTYKQAQAAWGAVKKQNIELASVELDKTRQDLKETQKKIDNLSYLKFIPIVNSYYADADHLAKAGFYGLDAAKILVDSLKPYTDLLGLKGKGSSFVMGSAEQRVQTAILTMGKITPRIDDVAGSLSKAKIEIDSVDPNRYPSFFGGDKIKTQFIALKKISDEGITFVEEARPLIKVLPSLLGESKERKYLVLFQNNNELRSTGGFITAYAIFRIDKGIIHVDRSDDIYSLDNTIGGKQKAPEPILKYLPKVSTFNLRDANISPDYIESMKTFESMYKKSTSKIDVDGIIALDTHVLVSTIKILNDEVWASGMEFTTKIDKRCDCPQVIYSLEDNITRPVNYVKTGRKDLLGELLYQIMNKSLKSSPKLYWGPLVQTMINEVGEKHILFYLFNEDAQKGIEALNAAGRIKPFDGDYLHINDTNFGGQKSNLFIKQEVTQNYEAKSDGSIVKTVTINYKNPFPPSDCNLERGGLCLNATLRNWLRIYVPKGSEMIESKGSEVKMTSYEEFGKTVFEGFLTVRPEGSSTFIISYKLPFKLANGSSLPLFIQKQPGTDKNKYIIKVNNSEKEKIELLTDKEVKINF